MCDGVGDMDVVAIVGIVVIIMLKFNFTLSLNWKVIIISAVQLGV